MFGPPSDLHVAHAQYHRNFSFVSDHNVLAVKAHPILLAGRGVQGALYAADPTTFSSWILYTWVKTQCIIMGEGIVRTFLVGLKLQKLTHQQ